MTLYYNHHVPSSPFFQSRTSSERLGNLRSDTLALHSTSTSYQKACHFTDDIISRFDRIQTLGGPDDQGEEIGHTGCVNALAWSTSGHCLATGSDDRRVILWKLGGSHNHPSSISTDKNDNNRSFPKLELAQSDVIETGHRANIFNIKRAPNCSDQRLFTCAGDNQIRVFDLSRASSFQDKSMLSGKEYKLWQEGNGSCTRVLRCHSSRAKKLSTENSPDIFLSAAEDGEVRQTDLRVPHTCSRSQSYGQGCPRPLMQFQMELYSLSVSKMEPWIFAVAGTTDKVYLQDRRMIPRLLKKEWGSHIDEETAALTHCIRRFTREPKETTNNDSNGTARRTSRAHVTAVKISEANGRDMLASFSGDGVYRFDIKAAPEPSKRSKEGTFLHENKRQRSISQSPDPQARFSTIKSASDDTFQPIRQEVVSLLFLEASTNRITRRYSKVLSQLCEIEEAIHTLPRSTSWLSEERSVMALSKVLVSIRRATAGLVETVDIDFESYKEDLKKNLTLEAKEEFLPIIDELEEANKCKAYSEEIKIRILLMDKAEGYIRKWWKTCWPSGQEARRDGRLEDVEEGMEREVDRQGDVDVDHASFHRRFRAMTDEASDEGITLKEQETQLVAELEADLNELDELYNDDIEEESGENSDEEMSEIESSEEEEDRNRHDISGGDAPLVYPNKCYTGHANNETVKDCGFIGSNDEYIWSGSDCGHFFIWSNDQIGTLQGIWKGDGSVVNVLAQHPLLPICAISGIDETIKIFGPVSQGSVRLTDAYPRREEIIQRNSRQERVGFSSRSIMRYFARHMAETQGLPRRMHVDGEGEGEEDCIIA